MTGVRLPVALLQDDVKLAAFEGEHDDIDGEDRSEQFGGHISARVSCSSTRPAASLPAVSPRSTTGSTRGR